MVQKKPERKQIIHFPIICTPHRTTFRVPRPHLDLFLVPPPPALHMDTHIHSFADTEDGGEAARWAAHYSLAASCQQQNQNHDAFLPHWFKTERKVCHQLWLLCYGRFEMSPNNLMKQNDGDPLPLQCTQFPPKDEARKQS